MNLFSMNSKSIYFLSFLLSASIAAQCQISHEGGNKTDLPYDEIPPYPEAYTPGNVAARMIDGLGYRYYWATEGLRAEDLSYQPSEEARSTAETLDHLYGLSLTIVNTVKRVPNVRPVDWSHLNDTQKRQGTLENFKAASELLKASEYSDIENSPMVFQRGEQKTEFPFWNLLNGPIADALYHVGQVVSFRRSSGNPIDPKVDVFMGKNRE